MKRIGVEGHSGCFIDIKKENGNLVIDKYTKDEKYIKRLKSQFDKQIAASKKNITNNIIVNDCKVKWRLNFYEHTTRSKIKTSKSK